MSKLTVKDLIGDNKKKAYKNSRLTFKVDEFSVDVDVKWERLDTKKILPFEEFPQTKAGKRVVKKLVGYNRGEDTYFEAIQNEKGKWVANMDKSVNAQEVEKVIMDKRTGEVQRKDTLKGLWFKKVIPTSTLSEWHIEDTYNVWAEENTDNMLKIYNYLLENNLMGVFKFNPYGTAYHGFLVPQQVNGMHFRLLLYVARVRINKVEVSPTMTIQDAQMREREKERIAELGTAAAIEEI